MKTITKIKTPQDIYLTKCNLKNRKLLDKRNERILDISDLIKGEEYKYTGGISICIENNKVIFGTATTIIKAIDRDNPETMIDDDSVYLLRTMENRNIEIIIDDKDIEEFKNTKGAMMFL